MARITVEDCMEQVPNRFMLVRMASIRAKQLKKGARALLTADENKEVVTSLREIADGLVKQGEPEEPVMADASGFAPMPDPGAAPATDDGAAAAAAADAPAGEEPNEGGL